MVKVVPDPLDDLFIDELDVFHDMEVRTLIAETLKPYMTISGTTFVWTEAAEDLEQNHLMLVAMIAFRVLQERGRINDTPSIVSIEAEMQSLVSTRSALKQLMDAGYVRCRQFGYELKTSRIKDACREISSGN